MPPIGDDLNLHLSETLLLLYNVFVNVRMLHLSLILLWKIITYTLLHIGVDRINLKYSRVEYRGVCVLRGR